ncbi:unnamed protein product [Cladocopium goreaui]|uniref:Uncharacterized protein n=1 Tax=Cladocopium goreaui TaxID=2562237 RepID=A0A9P1BJ40_9DINO|nr:unnamed protein product [Cladocopium goreaui]
MTPSQFDLLVKRMIAVNTPKVVVLLVLLVWWLDIPKHHDAPYQVIEYFAGVGRIAALAKLCGFTTAAVDIDYSREWGKRMGRRPPMDLNGNAGLVLCIHLLLSSEWEAVAAFLAIVCSSFVPVNRGSTWRSILTPLGNEEFVGVRRGNKLVARSVILMLITYLANGVFLVENPGNSLIAFHPRWVWFLEQLRKHGVEIQKVAFWMRKYGCNSWKRTWLWANSNRIAALDRGPLTATEKSTARPTTTRYKNKSGETKFKGNSSLKGSQKYTYKYAAKLITLLPDFRSDARGRPFAVSSEPLQEQFAAMSYDDEGKAWEQEADLRDVIQYVRGAKKLIIPLLSRVFSTETLAAGLQLVKTEAGMSDLSDLNLQELEAELRELEAGHVDLLQFVDLLMFWYPLFHPLPWAIPFHIPLSV